MQSPDANTIAGQTLYRIFPASQYCISSAMHRLGRGSGKMRKEIWDCSIDFMN